MAKKDQEASHISYDRLIKSMLRNFYADLGVWLLGERPANVKALDTALPTTAIRFADKLLHFEFRNRRPLILHLEFQSGGDKEMPQRMAQYFTLLLGTLNRPEFETARFGSLVVYLDKEEYKDDPGCLEVKGEFGSTMVFRYCVMKLWELDPKPILGMESPGLCPLVPLMSGNPIELVLKSQDKISQAPEALCSAEAKRELLAILGGLSSIVIRDRQFLRKLFSEIRVMKENYFFDLIRKEGEAIGLAKGREEGRKDATRRAILQVLQSRFGSCAEVSSRLDKIEDLGHLEALLVGAVACDDLQTFVNRLG